MATDLRTLKTAKINKSYITISLHIVVRQCAAVLISAACL